MEKSMMSLLQNVTTTFLLLAALLLYVDCQDCTALGKCMSKYGGSLNISLDMTDSRNLRQFFDTICLQNNIDSLVKCYNPEVVMGCQALQGVLTQGIADKMKDQMNRVCSQKEDAILLVECITKPTVGQAMSKCISTQTSDGQGSSSDICPRMSAINTCVERAVSNQCQDRTLNFLRTYSKEQYDMTCSAHVHAVNIFFVYIIAVALKLLL